MSVFGWRTFLDLRPRYDWQVTTLFVKCPLWVSQPTKPTQPSCPPWSVSSSPCNYIDNGGGGVKRQPRAMYGCLTAGQSSWTRAWTLWPVGCTPVLSVTQKRPCSCGMWLVRLYKCYMPLLFPITAEFKFAKLQIRTITCWWYDETLWSAILASNTECWTHTQT